MGYAKLTDSQIAIIHSHYSDISLTTYDIAEMAGCRQSAVYSHLTKKMIDERRTLRHELFLSKKIKRKEKVVIDDMKLLELRKRGLNLLEISKELQCNHSKVTNRLFELDVEFYKNLQSIEELNIRKEDEVLDGVNVDSQIKHYKASVINYGDAIEYMQTKFKK